MSKLRQYRKKNHCSVHAVQLQLPECKLQYDKWGAHQQATTGDWLVTNQGDSYTVEQESFNQTYRWLYGDMYRKVASVWAEVADENGSIATKEGSSRYQRGDYLVYNEPDRRDGYAVAKQTFENNYCLMGGNAMAMSADDYLQSRVDDQIEWYEKKAAHNQRLYKRLQLVAILSGAAIPLLTVVSFKEWEAALRFVIALLGSTVAVVAGLSSVNKYQENWVKYRGCAEALRREKYHYLTGTDGYSQGDVELLVGRCEAIMASEQNEWVKTALPQRPPAAANVAANSVPANT